MFPNTSNPLIKSTDPNFDERDVRMSKNCEIFWGTQCQFDFGIEQNSNGKYVMYVRRVYSGSGGELLLLSGVHEDDQSAWEEVDGRLIGMTEFVRKKRGEKQELAEEVAQKKTAQDQKRVNQVVEKNGEVEEWPALGSGVITTRNSRGPATSGGNGVGLSSTAPGMPSRNIFEMRYPGPEINPRNNSSSRDYGEYGYGARNNVRQDGRSIGYSNHKNGYGSRDFSGSSYGSGNSGSMNTEEAEGGKKPEMTQDERLELWGRVGDRRRRG